MYLYLLFMLYASCANGLIYYPNGNHFYTDVKEQYLNNIKYKNTFETYVCNTNNYELCENYDYIGVGNDEFSLKEFKNLIGFITFSNSTFNDTYEFPIISIDDQHVAYGINMKMPFLVRIYEKSPYIEISKYFMYIFIFCIMAFCTGGILNAHIQQCIIKRKKLSSIKMKSFKENSLLNTNCTICLDDFKPNEKIAELKDCQHNFHKECISEWFETKRSCPNCQNEVI